MVALGQAARGVHARDHALALVQLALERLEHERLVVAEAHDVDHARAQSPSSHSTTPWSATWPPPVA